MGGGQVTARTLGRRAHPHQGPLVAAVGKIAAPQLRLGLVIFGVGEQPLDFFRLQHFFDGKRAAASEVAADLAFVLAHLAAGAPEGPWMFPEDQISDMPERLLAAEITREKLYLQLRQELPYAATVETETWTEMDDGSARIEQVIYVQRGTQKATGLGKKGARIKSIGADSRLELEELLDRRVHLFLFVKVREKWGDDPERYRDWGLDYNA